MHFKDCLPIQTETLRIKVCGPKNYKLFLSSYPHVYLPVTIPPLAPLPEATQQSP